MTSFRLNNPTVKTTLLAVVLAIAASASAWADPPRRADSGVLFTYSAPSAQKVYLAGDFNGWGNNSGGKVSDPAFEMIRGAGGIWRKTVTIGTDLFRYKFVEADTAGNSSWHADPSVADRDVDGNSVYSLSESSGSGGEFQIDTKFLKFRFDPASGAVSPVIYGRDRRIINSLKLPAISMDGHPLDRFAPADTARMIFKNPDVTVQFTVVGPRAISATWIPRDGRSHGFQLRVPDNSAYYGGGERFQALNQKGYVLPMSSIDHPEEKGSISYKPAPFYMSTAGYGIWIANFEPGTFDLNATDRTTCIIRYPGKNFTMVFFAGPGFADILDAYTAASGRPSLPPAWAFAPWKSRDVHKNREEILQDVELTRANDLPASVLVIDSPWEEGYNDFVLNRAQFKDPRAMFDRVQALGFYPCFWLTPFVNSKNVTDMAGISANPTSNYAEAAAKKYLVRMADGSVMKSSWWKGEGGLVDFTNPAAVKWWQEQVAKTKEWGARAFKCDDGEGNFVQDAVFSDGSTALEMKNRYAALYLKTMHEYVQTQLGGNGTLLARPGFSGTQKYPFCWAGDNYADFSYTNGLPTAILAGQTAALSGIPFWGHDIAGYQGRPTKEVFIRWTQFGAFSPLMMVHMTSNLGPWDFDTETLDIYRTFAKLHTALFPYIYEAAHEAVSRGVPIIRPMVLAAQDDPVAAAHPFQYFFGPDILVAPMYQGGTYRTVYLPAGRWIDYWTGDELDGKQKIEVHAPLDRLPLFVRAGSVIPMIPKSIDTLIRRTAGMAEDVTALDDRRVIQVWPGGAGGMSTWEGLSAQVSEDGEHGRLTVESRDERPVDIQFMFRRLNEIKSSASAPSAPSAPVYDDAEQATVCRWETFKGKTELSW